MGSNTGIECPYVSDGLIFWLDGIEKGDTVYAWTDLVGGIVLNAGGTTYPTAMDDCYDFTGAGYFRSSTLLPQSEDTTLEICATWNGTTSFFHSGDGNGASKKDQVYFYPYKSLWFLQREKGYSMGNYFDSNSPYANKDITVSVNLDRCIISDTVITAQSSGTDYWTTSNYTSVGWFRNNYHTGKIFSIRVYSRRLSEQEQKFNINVDSERFGTEIF